MCGLTGIMSTNFSAWEYDVFRKLLFLNVFRGEDSTGIIRIGEDRKVHHKKILQPSNLFISDEKQNAIITDNKGLGRPSILMGHTRHATKGVVSQKNAHPFNFSNVIGMHNGTIHTKFKHRDEYDTDSEAFYRNLNDYGLEEALYEISAHDTAYAFQWYDKKKKTLNFIKNSKRPLWFTYAYGTTTLVWSSDVEMLKFVMRNKNYTSNTGWDKSTTDKYFTLDDNCLMSIDASGHPWDDMSSAKVKVKTKSYGGGSSNVGFTQGVSQKSQSTTLGSNGGLTYQEGEWQKTNRGYRFVKKSSTTPPPTQNSAKSPSATGTSLVVTSATTKESQSTTTASKEVRRDGSFREQYGEERLRKLEWLQPAGVSESVSVGKSFHDLPWEDPNFESANNQNFVKPEASNVLPFPKADSGERRIKGYRGELITAEEFQHHLQTGCFCCSKKLDLNDAHQFGEINTIHWWDRSYWACDDCYENSDGDWVKHTINDTWGEEPDAKAVKGE